MQNISIIAAVLLTAVAFLSNRLAASKRWRAMITPLASIIGSGFLVLGPILDASYGYLAPLIMAALCIGAYLFGWTIRFNIQALETDKPRGSLADGLENLASWSLAFAYVISVTYYLNLFGAFGVNLTPLNGEFYARMLTTAAFAVILITGWWKGFKALERMEYLSVAVKLAIISGVLVGLAFFFFGKWQADALIFNPPQVSGLSAITLAFGLIITVQGFETSRYLGAAYKAETRIKSMQLAQWLSALIYMVYTLLLSYVFTRGELVLTETAIIDMMRVVAPILPFLLVAAALAAQLSAAIADTSGSGGLFVEITSGKISARQAYALLTAIGLVITWTADVFEIIAYASRAFAVYYSLQAAIAAATSAQQKGPVWRTVAFSTLSLLGALIAIFGQSVEG
nr:hypothetical protein [Rhizobium sp. L1K21]